MESISKRIYEDFINKKASKIETIDLLLSLIENSDDDLIRIDCIKTLSKLDYNSLKVFNVLEQILISEANQDLRYVAAQIIKNKHLDNALDAFIWTLQHEPSYDVLITAIKSLEELGANNIISVLIDEISKQSNESFEDWIDPYDTFNLSKEASVETLIEILINLITLNRLQNKFEKIKCKFEKGFIIELDFSKVDKQIIDWHDRECFQNQSEIKGIKNLKNLKKLEFFSEKWGLRNELTFKSSIALIESLEQLNNNLAKEVLISQIKRISDERFNLSVNDFLKLNNHFGSISVSKLSDILKNYFTIAFLKKKYPSIEYSLEMGEIISIYIENEPMTTIQDYIKHFHAIRSLTLKACRLYNLPESIGSFKHLENLNLNKNNLNTLPESIYFLSSLKVLNLSNNKLENLDPSIGSLSSLEVLNLESNNLYKLPDSVGHLNSLIELNVGKNKLKSIPSSIGTLKSLKFLNLSYNNIQSLPSSIGLIYSLENLTVDNNSLEQLPDSINSATSLKILNLEGNKLKNIPESLGLLKSLEILRLGWNNLQKLPVSIGTLDSLKSLHLSNNKLINLCDSLSKLNSLEI
ncbi:MAG: hypothetical protein ACFFKA_10595, partial [Candidatus Thorarchaeota archaeon]